MLTIRISSLALLFYVLLYQSTATGLAVQDLYVAEVLVTDQSQPQLDSGAKAGLLQVLVRVSGTAEVTSSSLIAGALRNPSSYYYQYSYESTDKELMVNGLSVPARLLRIHFDPSAVARLLRRGAFPVWGSNRPSVLMWIATSDENGRRILNEAENSNLIDGLRDQATLRGVPLLFPLLDLEDSNAISTAEVWGSFLQRVSDASYRYAPDCILTGRLQVDAFGRWTANWSYRIEDEWQSIDDVSFSSDEVVQRMVDRLANELAEQYALDSSRGAVTLRIEDIDGLSDYAALTRYLESLTPVVNSSVVRVQGEEVEFRLNIEGQREQLIEIIALDTKLMLLSQNGDGNTLHYRWLP